MKKSLEALRMQRCGYAIRVEFSGSDRATLLPVPDAVIALVEVWLPEVRR